MILITGATGNIGAALVKELVASGQKLRAFVTDPAAAKQTLGDRVELAKGTYADTASVDAALAGVDKLFLLTPAGAEQPAWEANVIAAAKRAGVQYVVKSSVAGAQYDATIFGKSHRAGEKLLEQSGMAWTFLRPVGYMSNAFMWVATIKAQGAFYQPLGDGKMASIDPRDIASVAAACLTKPGHERKSYDLTGPEPLSCADQAKILGDAIGKPIKFVDVPDPAAKDAMLGMGMSATMADAMLEFTNLVRSGGAAFVSDAVPTVTGKPGRTFAAWCKENAAAFK